MSVAPRSNTDLLELFERPPAAFSPVPFWWWSGERLTQERLDWQLERLAEGGVRNTVVINLAPAGPAFGAPADDPPWFSDEWWQLFLGVCAKATELDVGIWFYDQLGFSGANVQGRVLVENPGFRGARLQRVAATVTGGACLLHCPAHCEPLGGAAIPVDGDGAPIGDPTSLAVENGAVEWRGRGAHRIMLAYAQPHGFDYLSPEACRALFDLVHGEFERRAGHLLGNPIRGSFQDELPRLNTWTHSFAKAFADRNGYDLRENLPALWEDLGTDTVGVRCDYHATRADLAQSAFFEPLHEWHERHGLMVGCDQQSPAREGDPIAGAQLYGDYLAATRWFSAPGSDHWGDAKIHSSLAHLYDRPRVWLEGFHSTGWDSTLEETYDWLIPWLRAGATLFNPHAVYYSTRGGWFEWAPPSSCWRQPYWRHYRLFADAVARLSAILSSGVHRCGLAVLYPSATVHAGLAPDAEIVQFGGNDRALDASSGARLARTTYERLVGRMAWTDPSPGVLDLDRRDFDVVDEASLQRASVSQQVLNMAGERYACLILPAVRVLHPATLEVLDRFCAEGGTIVAVGGLPEQVATRGGDRSGLEHLAQHAATGRLRLVATADEVPAALTDLERLVEAPVPTLVRQVGDRHVLFVPAAFPGATVVEMPEAPLLSTYSFEPERYAEGMTIRVGAITGEPWLWDVFSGTRRRLPTRMLEASMEVDVDFRDGPAALIVFEPTSGTVELANHPSVARDIEIDGDWVCELVGTPDNTWGDIDVDAAIPPFSIWSLGHRNDEHDDGISERWWEDERLQWAKVRATFGPHAILLGPRPVEQLPLPLEVAGTHPPDLAEADNAWRNVEYSTTYGIENDPSHTAQFGAKGYVPDEFIRTESPSTGCGVQLRSIVVAERAGRASLVVGAAASRLIWWNGDLIESRGEGYQSFADVDVLHGPNLLEIRLVDSAALSPSPLVGGPALLGVSWALVDDPGAFERPEWITAGGEAPVRYERAVELPFQPASAALHVGCAARVSVSVNGRKVGEQGEHGTYETMGVRPAFFRYDVGRLLHAGTNDLILEVANASPLLVDLAALADDATRVTCSSGASWIASREGAQLPVELRRLPVRDPRAYTAAGRAHPLPAAEWLEQPPPPSCGVWRVAAATRAVRTIEWFCFALPPGCERLNLPVTGPCRCFIDGREMPVTAEHTVEVGVGAQSCTVRVDAPPGHAGGGAWSEAPSVSVGSGRVPVGDWRNRGLTGYSGGLRYRREVELDDARRIELDLGGVRGSVEVHLNGEPVGCRICGPWIFDLTAAARDGANDLSVTVFNTIGARFSESGPSRRVARHHGLAGLLGPVRITLHN